MFKKNCLALLSLGLFSSFANASMHLPHELIAPVFKHLTDADIYPVTKINFLFASWLYGEKKNMAGLSESESLKLYRQWVFDNYKAGHPGFAGLYAFLKTEKNGTIACKRRTLTP